MSLRRLSVLLALVFVLPACRTQNVTKIVIRSVWVGMDFESSKGDRLEIVCQGKKCASRGKPVPLEDITALLQVLAAPPLPQAELPNLGLTQQWLNENAKSLRGERGCDFAQEHKTLLTSRFTNLQEVQQLLPVLLNPGITDDYPFVRIEILKNGETMWLLGSSSQSHLFMLPWDITAQKKSSMLPWGSTTSTKTFVSYNAEIGRSIGKLLPEGFVNRDRLAGADLNIELGRLVATRFLGFCEAFACMPCRK
jgi:hypothetical protein